MSGDRQSLDLCRGVSCCCSCWLLAMPVSCAVWSVLWSVRCTTSSHCHVARSGGNMGNFKLVVHELCVENRSWALLPWSIYEVPRMLLLQWFLSFIVWPKSRTIYFDHDSFLKKCMLNEKNDYYLFDSQGKWWWICNLHKMFVDVSHPARDCSDWYLQEHLWTKSAKEVSASTSKISGYFKKTVLGDG